MAIENAARDENHTPSILGVDSNDGISPVKVYADASTHRLLVSGVGTTGPTGPTGATGPDAYTAASTGNWNGSAPTTFTSALDRIAAKIGPIS